MLAFLLKIEEESMKYARKKLKEPENIKKKEINEEMPEPKEALSLLKYQELLKKYEQLKKVFLKK